MDKKNNNKKKTWQIAIAELHVSKSPPTGRTFPTYRRQVSQADGEANCQGCRAADIAPSFISDCNDTQHQLEGCQQLDAHALAGSDVAKLRESREREPEQQHSVSQRRIDGLEPGWHKAVKSLTPVWQPSAPYSLFLSLAKAPVSVTPVWLRGARLSSVSRQ